VGHRDVPGKPAMFGSTRAFLDYFGLKKLDDLPPLAELAAMEPVAVQLELGTADQEPSAEAQSEDAQAEQGDSAQAEGNAEAAASPDADADNVDDETGANQVNAEAGGAETEVEAAQSPAFVDEDEDEDDGDGDLDDDFLASALALADSANSDFVESSQRTDAGDDSAQTAQTDEQRNKNAGDPDVAPGAVAPLVGLNAPGAEQPEPATVASLDDARAAAAASAGTDEDGHESADVVPIKNT